MRRIRPATIVSSLCAAVDGGRATIAAPFSAAGDGGFLHTDPKPNVRTPHTDIFGGQSSWPRKQLKNEESSRKILFRNYGGRATQKLADKEKLVNKRKLSCTNEEFSAFVKNLMIECYMDDRKFQIVRAVFNDELVKMTPDDDTDGELGDATQNERVDELAEIAAETGSFTTKTMIEFADYDKYGIVHEVFHDELEKVTQDDESGDATQNDRVDKLAEIAEEELDVITNSFVTKLMIEGEPKYEKHFREVIEKIRTKMIQDDGILGKFELITNLMSKCEPEYDKLLCEVLGKVRAKICQDDMGGNDNISKIENLAKLVRNEGKSYTFEEKLDEFVTKAFLRNLRMIEELETDFMACEVFEKVAKKAGTENIRKIAEDKLDALVTNSFLLETLEVQRYIPYLKLLRLGKHLRK